MPAPLLLGIGAVATSNQLIRGFLLGVASSFFVFGLWYPFVLNGSHARALGGDAEGFTSEELRKLDRKRWVVVDDVLFDGFNVDHVLIGPGRVYAVETKWRSGSVDRWQREEMAKNAARSADKVRSLLRAEKAPAAVEALVVVWGPGSHALEGVVERIDGVRIVAGPAVKEWRPRLDKTAQGMEINYPVIDAIRRYVVRRDEYLVRHGR
ncbi:MAG: nuclease-related domain-containing protein [Nitriliruptor sp.]